MELAYGSIPWTCSRFIYGRTHDGPVAGPHIGGGVIPGRTGRLPSATGPARCSYVPQASDVRLRLARAVADGPDGFVVAPDNRAVRWAPLAELVADDVPFAVVPARRLFVVDCDPSTADTVRRQQMRVAFDQLVAAARAARVPLVVTASGRPGHRHAFLVTDRAAADERAALTAACRRAGLDVRDNGIRPPLAAHRTGAEVALLEPVDPAEAAGVLEGPGGGPGSLGRVASALGGRRLSLRVRRLLRDGHTAAGLPSASEGRMTVAVAVRGVGLPQTYLAALLEDPANRLTASFLARPARWRQRELDRLWVKAGRWLQDHPLPTHDVEERRRAAATWRAALDAVAWPGVGGASALAVAEALGELAARLGRPRVGASLDDVAVAAGLSRDAARGALRRLAAAGWLAVAAAETPTQARVYDLLLPAGLDAGAVSAAADAADAALLAGDEFADLGADVARWSGGIGKSAARVARALSSGPAHVAELADRLHMTANAVRIHLRRLAALGVVVREAGRMWRRTRLSAATVAGALGSAGARARQVAGVLARRAARAAARSRLVAAAATFARSRPRPVPGPQWRGHSKT